MRTSSPASISGQSRMLLFDVMIVLALSYLALTTLKSRWASPRPRTWNPSSLQGRERPRRQYFLLLFRLEGFSSSRLRRKAGRRQSARRRRSFILYGPHPQRRGARWLLPTPGGPRRRMFSFLLAYSQVESSSISFVHAPTKGEVEAFKGLALGQAGQLQRSVLILRSSRYSCSLLKPFSRKSP